MTGIRDKSLRSALITGLDASVQDILATMAWTSVSFEGREVVPDLLLSDGVAGLVRMQGDHEGMVAISTDKPVGMELVSRIIGLPADDLNTEDLLDGVGELANMICGGMKAKAGIGGVQLSSPVAIVGREYSALWKTHLKTEILSYALDKRLFRVHACF
ncbi:MAG: chemotaxis protein CheX [Magnetococcales bacterium]|nr:chemotaxis protein CheX [Magnetococcales bacterium]